MEITHKYKYYEEHIVVLVIKMEKQKTDKVIHQINKIIDIIESSKIEELKGKNKRAGKKISELQEQISKMQSKYQRKYNRLEQYNNDLERQLYPKRAVSRIEIPEGCHMVTLTIEEYGSLHDELECLRQLRQNKLGNIYHGASYKAIEIEETYKELRIKALEDELLHERDRTCKLTNKNTELEREIAELKMQKKGKNRFGF